MADVEKPQRKEAKQVDYIAKYGTVFTAVLVLAGTIYQTKTSSNVELVTELHRRIEVLESRAKDCDDQIFVIRSDYLSCTLREKSERDTKQFLQNYIDTIPGPAWVKKVVIENDEIVFRMVTVNRAYEDAYHVSRAVYEGRTDFDIWSEDVARSFYMNDLTVYKNKKNLQKKETFPIDNKPEVRTVWKWAFELSDDQWAIGGLVIE